MTERDNRREPDRRRKPPEESARPKPRPRPSRRGGSTERVEQTRAVDPYAEAYPYAERAQTRPAAGRRTTKTGVPSRGTSGPGRDEQTRPRLKKILRYAALFFALAVVVGLVATGVVYASIARNLPDPTKQMKGRDQTTRVLDRHGRLLAKLYADQNRTNVPLSKVPVVLRQAVIATEDERYYEHKGVDPLGIVRAIVTDVRTGRKAQGGSTITQQYVKQAFMTPEKSLKRKLAEAALAYRVEKTYSKDKILEMYLNTIYFGHGAYGIETAAQTYFGKHVGQLDVAESAMLAGVIKSPAHFSPYFDPVAAKTRRGTVLAQMRRQGYVDQTAYERATAEPFKLAGLKSKSTFAPYFMDYIKGILTDKYGAQAVYRGGLTVRTTLDVRLQRAAEKAAKEALGRPGDPSASLVALEPSTGQILAMVGGTDYKHQQYNVATQGHRQPGSAFKPFVLVTALESSVSPEATFESGPRVLHPQSGPTWRVTGAGGGRRGPMRLREATERSVNSVYAQLILNLGADKVAETAKKLGIASPIEPVPAIALGGLERGVTPLEMASAYATLADGGVRHTPQPFLEVRDAQGKVLQSFGKPKGKRAIPEAVAYLATDILRGVIQHGTGEKANIGRPAAGKTGTTQAYRDAWFVGYTPQIAASVWVGYPDAAREMNSVHGIKVTGGSFPAQIWAAFMREALKGRPEQKFERPRGLSSVEVCAETGLRATQFCPKKVRGLFLGGHVPRPCDVHTTPTQVVMPNLIGMTKDAALALLQKLKLLFKVVERDVQGVAAGVVAGQTPKAGSKATTETVVTVVVSNGGAGSKAPVANFTFSPDSPSFGQPVAFNASTSTDDGKIVSYVWEFGDGTKGAGKTVAHTYSAAGISSSFEVILWVTDDHGLVSSVRKTISVK